MPIYPWNSPSNGNSTERTVYPECHSTVPECLAGIPWWETKATRRLASLLCGRYVVRTWSGDVRPFPPPAVSLDTCYNLEVFVCVFWRGIVLSPANNWLQSGLNRATVWWIHCTSRNKRCKSVRCFWQSPIDWDDTVNSFYHVRWLSFVVWMSPCTKDCRAVLAVYNW